MSRNSKLHLDTREEYEEEEEYYDEDEEEEESIEERVGKKRKMERLSSKYIAEEAEVDRDEDTEDELLDEAEEGIVDDLSSLGEAESTARPKLYSKLQLDSEEAMMELADKYMRQEREENELLEQSGHLDSDIVKQTIIPTANEPMIWMVHCKIGKEKEVMKELMARFLVEKETPLRPLIFTVIVHDHIPGFVYVEAQRESHVTAAISGLAFVLKKPLKLISCEEMPLLLKVPKIHQTQEGDWVRIKSYVTRGDGGLYKRDLARVHRLVDDAGKSSVIVLLVPRLNTAEWSRDQSENVYYDYEKDVGNDKQRRRRKPTIRYPQKLFNSAAVNSVIPNAVKKVDDSEEPLEIWNGMTFLNGYLYVQLRLSNLVTENVNPTQDELLMFLQCQENVAADIQNVLEKGVKLEKGDVVRVIRGELNSVIGVITSTDGEDAYIIPHSKQISTIPLAVPLAHLTKHFKNGDRIKVISGAYADETGMIVDVSDDNKITFVSDSMQRELEVNAADVHETAEINSGKVQVGTYGLCDLIQFEGNSTGVIVKVDVNSVLVVDTNNHTQLVQLHEIVRKRRVNSASLQLDCGGSTEVLYVGDIAKVIGESEGGSSVLGNIIHIYGDRAWLQCREVKSNNGIVCANRFNLKPLNSRSSSSTQSKSFGVRRHDALLKAPVHILEGQWKGYKGTVKFITEDLRNRVSMARVELDIGSRMVMVRVDKLKDLRSHTMQYNNVPYQNNLIHQSSNYSGVERTPARLDMPQSGEQDVWNHYMGDILPGESKMQSISMPQTPGVSLPPISDSFMKSHTSFLTPIPPSMSTIPTTPGSGLAYSSSSQIVPSTPIDQQQLAIPPTPGGIFNSSSANHNLLLNNNNTPQLLSLNSLSQQQHFAIPPTPGGAFNSTETYSSSDWFVKNVQVKIKAPQEHQGKIGYISEILSKDQCTVTLLSINEQPTDTLKLSKSDLDSRIDLKGKDSVLIIQGPYKGEIGSLLDMDKSDDYKSTDCIVKFSTGTSVPDNAAIVPIDHLVKVYNKQRDKKF